jgi:hypothetical protein
MDSLQNRITFPEIVRLQLFLTSKGFNLKSAKTQLRLLKDQVYPQVNLNEILFPEGADDENPSKNFAEPEPEQEDGAGDEALQEEVGEPGEELAGPIDTSPVLEQSSAVAEMDLVGPATTTTPPIKPIPLSPTPRPKRPHTTASPVQRKSTRTNSIR